MNVDKFGETYLELVDWYKKNPASVEDIIKESMAQACLAGLPDSINKKEIYDSIIAHFRKFDDVKERPF